MRAQVQNALNIVLPSAFRRLQHIMGVKAGERIKARTVNPDLGCAIKSIPTLRALRNGHRHNQATAIINVFPNKVNSPRASHGKAGLRVE